MTEHTSDRAADEVLADVLQVSHAKPRSSAEASKTKIASFRLSAEAHVVMTAKAAEAGISTRSWLEQAILQNRTQIVARAKPHPELKPLLFQAGKAGNNLNQLAHRFNALRMEGKLSEHDCLRALEVLGEIQASFREAVANARSN